MYRVFLFITILAYCSSVPFRGPNIRQSAFIEQNDDTDLVDNFGAGYSFFKKQKIDARPLTQPSLDMPSQDFSEYMQASAFKKQPVQTQIFPFNNGFGQQQLIPRSNIQLKNLLPKTIQVQQPVFVEKDLNGYRGQQGNLPVESNFLAQNIFGNQPQQDLRAIGSQQILLPQTNLNIQQKAFDGYGNQQQDLSFIQQPWNKQQQQSAGFSSSYSSQDQQPASSGFFIQSNQQNDQQPITNAVFMSSQIPTQRFISQPKQQIFYNDGW